MPSWHHIPIVRDIGYAAIYFPIRGTFAAVACLPSSLHGSVCRGLATLARWTCRGYVRIARKNLARVLPELSADEHRAIVRGMFRHFALNARDIILLWQNRSQKDVIAKFVDSSQLTPVAELEQEGNGLIQVSGHFGNWEVAGFAIGSIFTVNGLSREFRNPRIRRTILRVRTEFGQQIIFPSHGFEEMLACLERNECLALLPDKHLRTSRIVVEFFGQRVYAPSGPAILSWRSGAPILVGGAFRIGESSRFTMEESAIIRPDRTQPKGQEIQRITQAYMSGLEALIRRHPEQWIWFHSRWKKKIPARRADRGSSTAGDAAAALKRRNPAAGVVPSSVTPSPRPVGPWAKRTSE